MKLLQIIEMQQEKLTNKELAGILRQVCDDASKEKKGQVAVSVIMFGIKYADSISSITDLVKNAGISPYYINQIRTGIKLAKYVRLI